MAFKDLREFIKLLNKTGDVVHIREEVDWDLEIGAIGRHAYEIQAPAQLYEKIKDYPGHRVFNGSLGTFRRVAIAMGLDPNTSVKIVAGLKNYLQENDVCCFKELIGIAQR